MFNSTAMPELCENRRNRIIISLLELDVMHCITVHVEVVRYTIATFVCSQQSAFAVTIVFGITPSGREVLVMHRPFLV
jgi:hypothetical protein